MLRAHVRSLISVIGGLYLCVGLVALIPLGIFLFVAPRNSVLSNPGLIYCITRILMFAPCIFIAYACFRRRSWGRYLLMTYNGMWLVYFAFIIGAVEDPKAVEAWVVGLLLIICIVLGSIIIFVNQEDVRW